VWSAGGNPWRGIGWWHSAVKGHWVGITIISALRKEASFLSRWWSTTSSGGVVKRSSTRGCFAAASTAKLVRGKAGYGWTWRRIASSSQSVLLLLPSQRVYWCCCQCGCAVCSWVCILAAAAAILCLSTVLLLLPTCVYSLCYSCCQCVSARECGCIYLLFLPSDAWRVPRDSKSVYLGLKSGANLLEQNVLVTATLVLLCLHK
jgi:hypothetical protein